MNNKVYNSIIFSTLTKCTHHHYLIPPLKITPVPICSNFPFLPCSKLWQWPSCLLFLQICLFWTVCINGIMHHVAFCDWFLSLCTVFKAPSYCGVHQHFDPFHGWIMFYCINILLYWWPCFAYPFIIQWALGLSPLLPNMNNATMKIHVQVFIWTSVFISLGYVPRSAMLGHTVTYV